MDKRVSSKSVRLAWRVSSVGDESDPWVLVADMGGGVEVGKLVELGFESGSGCVQEMSKMSSIQANTLFFLFIDLPFVVFIFSLYSFYCKI